MVNKISIFYYCFLFLLLFSCDNPQNVDRTGLKEEKARRELKKVSEAEILNEATLVGKQITTDTEKYLEQKSLNHLEGFNNNPIRKANINWIHNMDSLEKIYDAEIRYLSLITTKDADQISPIEAELLDAYQYNIEKKIALSENIQKIEKGYLLYNKPIILNSSSCLKCHGKLGEEVTDQSLASMSERFPNSTIHGYSLGSIMGFWSIRLSQKKIIQEM